MKCEHNRSLNRLCVSLLDMALAGDDIKRDDATGVIADVASNDVGRRLAWDFVRSHWDVIIRE